jgi:hypothetical protein
MQSFIKSAAATTPWRDTKELRDDLRRSFKRDRILLRDCRGHGTFETAKFYFIFKPNGDWVTKEGGMSVRSWKARTASEGSASIPRPNRSSARSASLLRPDEPLPGHILRGVLQPRPTHEFRQVHPSDANSGRNWSGRRRGKDALLIRLRRLLPFRPACRVRVAR